MSQSLLDTLLREMVSQVKIKIDGALVRQAQHIIKLSEEEQRIKKYLEDSFREAGLNPPDINKVTSHVSIQRKYAEKIYQLLLKQGDLVRINKDLIIHREHLDALKEKLGQFAQKKSIINIADFKSLTGLTRKNAIPLLEYLDQIKITKREGNNRRILVGKSH